MPQAHPSMPYRLLEFALLDPFVQGLQCIQRAGPDVEPSAHGFPAAHGRRSNPKGIRELGHRKSRCGSAVGERAHRWGGTACRPGLPWRGLPGGDLLPGLPSRCGRPGSAAPRVPLLFAVSRQDPGPRPCPVQCRRWPTRRIPPGSPLGPNRPAAPCRRRSAPPRRCSGAESSLEQFEHRSDLSCASGLDGLPGRVAERLDANGHPVEPRSQDQRVYPASLDRQIADCAVADVAAAARQPIAVVGEGLQVLAPALAPEAPGDQLARDLDRLHLLSLLAETGGRPCGPCSPCGDWNVGRIRRHVGSSLAAWSGSPCGPESGQAPARVMSKRTRSSSSSSESSVSFTSPPSSRRSFANLLFSPIIRSMRSSMVPRAMNLWTSTLRR